MSKIIKRLYPEVIKKTAARCRKRGLRIPTFKEMRHPELIPPSVTAKLKGVGLWDVNPVNLFRITWKNDLKSGLYGGVNYVEIPSAITGVKARIIGLAGKFFPTGAHKVGAAFGCLVPRLVSGEFDPETHKAAWPSTGNYCRGGAFDCALLDCTAIAILPEGMSRERFEWLKQIGAQVIATPGCESNVKEIYDKCWELKKDPLNIIFNQFEEFGNPDLPLQRHRTRLRGSIGRAEEPAPAPGGLHFRHRLRRHHRRGGFPQEALSSPEDRRHRGAPMPHPAAERVRRASHRGHRRQARPVGPQRSQHGRRGGH